MIHAEQRTVERARATQPMQARLVGVTSEEELEGNEGVAVVIVSPSEEGEGVDA